MGRAVRPLLDAVMASGRGRALMLRNTVAHPDHVPASAARRLVFGWLDSRAHAATSGEMRGAAFEDQGLVRVPVKIAWAEHDRVVSRAGPERLPPGAHQLVLAGLLPHPHLG